MGIPAFEALGLTSYVLFLATVIAFFGGFAKGVVGFAIPLIMFTGLSMVMPVEYALAALILPAFVTNILQMLRGGAGLVIGVFRVHWRFVIVISIGIAVGAQLVPYLPRPTLLVSVGIPITGFALVQLAGWRPKVSAAWHRVTEIAAASVAGVLAGMAGTWGAPTVMYLAAIDTPKAESVRVQGLIYSVGSVALLLAHLRSGVFNAETAVLSGAMLVPALIGMWVGVQVQDRMNQEAFRKATLFVLVFAGLNLVRRGLVGG